VLVHQVYAATARQTPPAGDVTVATRRRPAPLELTFPADTGQLAPARFRLRQWLENGVPVTQTAQDALVAAGEAVANAIEHGHRDQREGEIVLRAEIRAGRLRLTITDSGQWRSPPAEPDPYRGKGLVLMRAMMDDVSIDTGPRGTTVTMEVRIPRDHSAGAAPAQRRG
jgi:anti-sigma regulatory factor (Ser/Thr protein kinase)